MGAASVAVEDYTSEQLQYGKRRSSVPIAINSLATASGTREPKSYLEELMPRILVSEEGECVNLTNEGRSEFSTTNASAAMNYGLMGISAGGKRIGGYGNRKRRGSPRTGD